MCSGELCTAYLALLAWRQIWEVPHRAEQPSVLLMEMMIMQEKMVIVKTTNKRKKMTIMFPWCKLGEYHVFEAWQWIIYVLPFHKFLASNVILHIMKILSNTNHVLRNHVFGCSCKSLKCLVVTSCFGAKFWSQDQIQICGPNYVISSKIVHKVKWYVFALIQSCATGYWVS